jgi:ketosteroid isomerase-like protein
MFSKMKTLTHLILLLMSAGFFTHCSSGKTEITDSHESDERVKEAAKALLLDWKEAYLQHLPSRLDTILSEDYTYSGAQSASTTSKQEAIANFKTSKATFLDQIIDDLVIRTYGNTAVVTGLEHIILLDGDTLHYYMRFTDVYVMDANGKMRAVATHSSPVPGK